MSISEFSASGSSTSGSSTSKPSASGLQGARRQFALASTYLNSAFMHPMPTGAADAIRHYLNARLLNEHADSVDMAASEQESMALFARLVHADLDELAWVPGTTAAENLVLSGLGLLEPGSHNKNRVVTDVFHFSGSLFMYNEFARQGLDLHIVKARDNRIELDDIDKALTQNTKLLAVSLVSHVAGFEHDLKALCAMAHAKGVLVYADIIQAVGAMPLNLQDSGVDFAACATYKWLMGDYGAGFLYVRRDRQHLLKRTQSGRQQSASITTHFLPYDTEVDDTETEVLLETQSKSGLAGKIGTGDLAYSAMAALTYSLNYLRDLGLDNIVQWRQPLLAQLREVLSRHGFSPMTPPESTSPIISFACENAAENLTKKLKAANINISLYRHHLRISPSFYNTDKDIDRLIQVLTKI